MSTEKSLECVRKVFLFSVYSKWKREKEAVEAHRSLSQEKAALLLTPGALSLLNEAFK